MSESVDNVSKKVLSNDYSSMMPGSIAEAYENGSPPRGENESPGPSALELIAGDFANRNKRKRKNKLQSKTELDKDTCRKWVRLNLCCLIISVSRITAVNFRYLDLKSTCY